jgi:hypothetical protein
MFSMLAMMTMFSIVFIYEIGKTEILEPILNVTLQAEQQLNVSVAMQTHAQDVKNSYDNIDIPYDLFFLYLWISSIAASIALALKSKKKSLFSLLGGMFFGLMGLLLIVFFIDQVQVWFFVNIFNAVFSDITLSLPIMDYYFANIGWISAVWFMSLLFLRQVDLDLQIGRRSEQ